MTEFFAEYGMFVLKVATVVALVGASLMVPLALLAGGSAGRLAKLRRTGGGELKVRRLDTELRDATRSIERARVHGGDWLAALRDAVRRTRERATPNARQIFVLDFKGDLRASRVSGLREEISALLSLETPPDEVVVRLESPGGMVPGYGLAAAQLQRVRAAGIRLTVCVDSMAASGGYLMACVADRIVAAPFAIVGSIGVLAPVPNFHRALKKRDIDYEEFKAGEYKRTVSLLAENTEEGRNKFQSEIDDLHALFKEFVAENRPGLDLDAVATGEYWYGARAQALNLIDAIRTSDDYLLAAGREADVLHLHWKSRSGMMQRLLEQSVARLSEGYRRAWLAGVSEKEVP